MDGLLRALFLDKGFTEDQLDTIEAQDSELRHVGDLAAGATGEDDARAWAEELGLNSRVSKSRFVRSWIEARSQASLSLDAGYTPSEPVKRAPSPPEEEHMPERKFVEEDLSDDWNWVKLSSQEEMAMTPTPQQETRVALSYIDGEPVSKPGGISDMLRSTLRSHGLTSVEVSQMEQTLEARSCKALSTAAATFEGAMRLARLCGIQSKVSQENFAKAWHQAAATMIVLHGGGSKSQQLVELVKDEDWEACTKLLMQRCQVSQPKELLPLLRGLLHQLAEQQRLKAKSKVESTKVLPTLASLYGPEAVAEAEKSTAMAQAEWRYSWMVRSFFNVRLLASLQAEVLNAYEAEEFQVACEELNNSWISVDRMPLDQKMRAIEALCLEHALKRILPRYGFKPDVDGMAEMKMVVTDMSKIETEVRRRQMLITAAVMKKFKL